ncbi:hypothetical protein [Priestia aryabhattai]
MKLYKNFIVKVGIGLTIIGGVWNFNNFNPIVSIDKVALNDPNPIVSIDKVALNDPNPIVSIDKSLNV